ncbi:MAG: aromatic amino acid ammonia-lyase [Pseudomonadota bacterium]
MIALNGKNLDISQLWRAAALTEPCALADAARPAMDKSRAYVERLAAEPRAIYGINTGFGPLSAHRVSQADQAQHQLNLLHHLSAGQGELFSPVETRAIMVARANSLCRGHSGIRPAVIDLALATLNAGILPEIPQEGSVGASGDLVPLAHMARALVGLGYVRTAEGRRLPATEALASIGLTPAVLGAKEGLALVNGTSVMTGTTALSVHEAGQLLSWAELLTAALFEVQNGAPEVLCEHTHRARGHKGQRETARRITAHLRTHAVYAELIDAHAWGSEAKPFDEGKEIQDPYSLRCVPQVLGAFQDALWHVEQVVVRELNATTDNPLIFADYEMVIHAGHFYGQHVAMVADYLRLGLVKLALLLDRQLEQLVNWRYSRGLSPMLAGGTPGLNSGMMGCQLLATAMAAEARMLATPASVQTIPTNANNQDVVSMGTHAARWTRRVLPLVWKLSAIQAIALCQASDLRGGPPKGEHFRALYERVRAVSPTIAEDRPLFEEVAAVAALLQEEGVQTALLPARRRG